MLVRFPKKNNLFVTVLFLFGSCSAGNKIASEITQQGNTITKTLTANDWFLFGPPGSWIVDHKKEKSFIFFYQSEDGEQYIRTYIPENLTIRIIDTCLPEPYLYKGYDIHTLDTIEIVKEEYEIGKFNYIFAKPSYEIVFKIKNMKN